MTDYEKLMSAVEQYYGSGSDQWAEIAKYGITAEHAEEILSQVPGVNVIKNADGKIRSYNFSPVENVASTAITTVNSNVPADNVSFSVPATTAVDTAGKMTFRSGLSKAGNFVFGDVIPAVAAAGAGITLGKTIDSLLYNANPDFWDEHNMETLNPDSWGKIVGTDTAGGKIFNMVFGTDPNNKTTQAYMDENALAYMALYLQNKNVFDKASKYTTNNVFNVNNTKYTIENNPNVIFDEGLPKNNRFILGENITTKPYQYYDVIDAQNDAKFIWSSYLFVPKNPIGRFIIASNKPFRVKHVINDDSYTNDVSYVNSDSRIGWHNEYNDILEKYPIYYIITSAPDYGTKFYPDLLNNIYQYSSDNKSLLTAKINNDDNVVWDAVAALNFLYGNHITTGGVSGIGNQENAKTPDLSSATTPEEVLAKLKEQYPELWQNSVTQDVVQPDGTTVTYTYVPVAMPDTDTAGNPVSASSTQENPKIDPKTASQNLIDTITQLISRIPPINPPDTGTGNTPVAPPVTGSASSLYAIYNPTIAEINSFGAWLWSDSFIDQIKKLFNDPMQAIIGLHRVFATPVIGGKQNIKVGYLDSGVAANVVTEQYTIIDCGTVNLSEQFHNVFDYAPYTQINLYLPFIGIVNLDIADVMRASIHIVYHVDVLSGACLAEVNVVRDGSGGTIYQYAGNASVTLPISSGSYMGIVASIASIAGGVAGTIASGGAAIPMIASAAGSALNARTRVEHSGSFSGNAGAMGGKKPYIIISRPQTELADNFEKYIGYPANFTQKLNSCTGFVRVIECHLENVNATDSEISEIDGILKTGVLI